MLKHVLIPLDGSHLAEKAIDAVKYMLPPDSKITLLTVVANAEQMPMVAVDSGEIPLDQYLEHIALRVRLEGLHVDIDIRAGETAEVIAQTAVTLGVEIIAMCTHGRSGLEQLISGSTTHRVLAISLCPVLVIPDTVRQRVSEEADQAEEAPATNLGLVS